MQMTQHFDYRPSAQRVKGHQHRWLAGGYDLEIGLFRGGYSMVVSWLIAAF